MVCKRQGPGGFTSTGLFRAKMTWWGALEKFSADGLGCLWKQLSGSLSLRA